MRPRTPADSRARRALALALLALAPSLARAAAFDVPLTHATLQAAVAAAGASADLDNVITISASPVLTNATVDFGNAFGPARRLVVRPADGLERASVANGNPTVPMVRFLNSGHVTLRRLDLLRNVTNGNHLVTIETSSDITIEGCRIGTNIPSTGLPGFANVHMAYPTNILLRNNVLFARAAGTFDVALDAMSFNDPANALRLYNNVFADYRLYGVRVDAVVAGPLVLLRNNVAANNPTLVPEPVAYRTQVAVGGPTVVSSHNTAFASAGNVQTGPGGTQDLAGLAASFLAEPLANLPGSFVTTAWTLAPAWDANDDFFRLVDGGPLHAAPVDHGVNVVSGGFDLAVVDDWERDVRPSGSPAHTDRGADQIEPVVRLGAELPGASAVLRARPLANPATVLALRFESARAGELTLEVFDVAGRRLQASRQTVARESHGVLAAEGTSGQQGLLFWRLRLEAADGNAEQVSGRALIGR